MRKKLARAMYLKSVTMTKDLFKFELFRLSQNLIMSNKIIKTSNDGRDPAHHDIMKLYVFYK